MTPDTEEQLLALAPGKKAVVHSCEAREHGENPGCVCHLKGKLVVIGKRYETPFAGTPSFHLEGHAQRVRLTEVVFV